MDEFFRMSKFKLSKHVKLVCGMVQETNDRIRENEDAYYSKMMEAKREAKVKDFMLNYYMPMDELKYSFQLLCGGISIRQPQLSFDGDRLAVTTQID